MNEKATMTKTGAGRRNRACGAMEKAKKIFVALCGATAAFAAACAFAACDEDEAHTLVHHGAVAPTCTTAGSIEYWECEECNKFFADADGTQEISDVTVAATGHTWTDGETVRTATYTQAGSKNQSCSVCGTVQTVETAALGYQADIVVEAGGSISAAVAAASDGDVIVVKAGTYAEQVVIEGKDLALIGEGEVVVCGPADYDDLRSVGKIAGESTDYSALFAAADCDVTVENITVRGNIRAARAAMKVTHDTRYLGVAAIDASLTLNYVRVEDIRYTDDYFGMQNGIGVYGVAETADRQVTMRYCSVTNFNKGAVVMRAGLAHFVCDGCVVAGAGEQAVTAQNGLQISCAATVTGCTVKDMKYSADNEWAHGSVGIYILTERQGAVTVKGNTLDNVDWGVYITTRGAADGDAVRAENTFRDLYNENNACYEAPPAEE